MIQKESPPSRYKFSRRAAWFFLSVTILLLGYTFYRSEIILGGWHSERYLKYYAIIMLGVLFFGVILRLGDEVRLNCILVISSCIAVLYSMEIFLFVIAKNTEKAKTAQVGANFDSRSKYEVYMDLIDKGEEAVPAVHPMQFIPTNGVTGSGTGSLFPFGGVSNKTTIMCNESGEYAIFPSDRYGFNNPDSVWDHENVQWVLTGDSYTQGACVNQGYGIAGQMRRRTRQPVINLGSGANGPLVELAVLEEYAKAKAPRTVLWVYYEGNDLAGDLRYEVKSALLMKYLGGGFSQSLINRQKEIDLSLLNYIRAQAQMQEQIQVATRSVMHEIMGVLRLLHLRGEIGFDSITANVGDDLKPVFADILRQARDGVSQWGGKFYFVYLPANIRYAEGYRGQGSLYDRDEVLNLVRGLGISIIDIHEKVFSKYPDPNALFVFRNSHYNAKGYNLVANAIVDEIEKGL